MPHIRLHAFHSQRNIKRIDIDVNIEFSSKYFLSGKANKKLKEIQQELQNVMEIYFDDFSNGYWLNEDYYNCGFESDD